MEPEATTGTSPAGGSNKTLWIVGVVIIIAIVAYFLMRGGSAPVAVTPGSGATGEQSIAELLAGGISQTCTFAQTQGTEGTVYIAGGKMRGDFKSVTNGQTMMSHMISDGTTAYTWVDGTPMGFKMMMGAQQTTGQQQQAVDVNQKLAYTCSPSVPNAAVFNLPAGVQFTDASSLGVTIPTGVAQ